MYITSKGVKSLLDQNKVGQQLAVRFLMSNTRKVYTEEVKRLSFLVLFLFGEVLAVWVESDIPQQSNLFDK